MIHQNLLNGNNVYPIYGEITNNSHKSKLEKNRIELLYKEFKKDFKYNGILKPINYVSEITIKSSNDSLVFQQLPLWFINILYSDISVYDEIQFGYIMGDDIVAYVNNIHNIYNSYKSIMKYMPKLKFPLIKKRKEEIIELLPENIINLVYSCESPEILSEDGEIITYKPCCNCDPCKKIIATNNFGVGLNDEYKKEKRNNIIMELKNENYKIYNEFNVEL